MKKAGTVPEVVYVKGSEKGGKKRSSCRFYEEVSRQAAFDSDRAKLDMSF
jgi:hypothetical protein